MTLFNNLDIVKNLQNIKYSHQIKCYSSRSDSENTLINIALLNMYWRWAMTSHLCLISIVENNTDYRPRDAMITK